MALASGLLDRSLLPLPSRSRSGSAGPAGSHAAGTWLGPTTAAVGAWQLAQRCSSKLPANLRPVSVLETSSVAVSSCRASPGRMLASGPRIMRRMLEPEWLLVTWQEEGEPSRGEACRKIRSQGYRPALAGESRWPVMEALESSRVKAAVRAAAGGGWGGGGFGGKGGEGKE